MRQQVSRALTGCCAVLWLTGFLSIGQGNLATQWTVPHCPNGQTQNSQPSHNHCTWHCGGLDIQSGVGRDEITAGIQVSRAWRLGAFSVQETVVESEFPPRGPPLVRLVA